ILVGNGTNVATSVALSGDATLANTGTLTIANNAITTGKILDGTIVAGDMGTGAVTTTQILDGTIATGDIGAGAVTTTEILDGTVANADISASAAIAYTKLNLVSAVKGSDLVDGTVDTADLANDSVTTGKIINGTILAEDLASNSITTAKITDGNVTTAKLSVDAKQTLKLDATVKTGNYSATGSDGVILANTSGGAFVIDLPTAIGSAGRTYTVKLTQGGNTLTIDPAGSETLDGSAVKTLSRTGDVLSVISDGTNWLTVSALADNAIVSSMISDGTIAASDLADNAVTTSKIVNASVTVDKLDPSARQTWNLNATAKTNTYTLTSSDGVILANTSAGAFTINFPTASGIAGRTYTIKLVTAGNNLTLDPANAETIDGASTRSMSSVGDLITVISDGANWLTVSEKSATVSTGDISDSAITSVKIADNSITNADINTSAAIAHSKLAALSGGQILVGNSSSVPVAVALSGDATLSNTGSLTIASDAVNTSKIVDNTITNADISTSAAIAYSKLNLAGNLTSSDITDGTIAAVDIASDAITTAKILNANVTAAKLSTDARHTRTVSVTAANYSITSADGIILADTSGGARTLTLPTAVGISGRIYTIKLATAGNTLTITPNGTETIDGSATQTLSVAGDVLTIVSDGTNWSALSGGSVSSSKIVDGTIANTDIATNAAIDHSKLANVTSGQILIGNGSNVPTAVAVSGDATLANTGALTIVNNAITTGKILDGTIAAGDIGTGAVTSTAILDDTITTADISPNAAIAHSKLASMSSGQILVGNGSSTPTAVAMSGDATLANTGALTIANDAITTGEILDGTIANADISPSAAIAYSKLNLAGTLTSSDITDGTIAAVDIASDAITTAKILNANVTAAKLSPDARHAQAINATAKTSVTSPYTLTSDDGIILADTSGGDVTLNLPTASGIGGRTYSVKLTTAGLGKTLTIDPSGTETIDGSATETLLVAGDVLNIVSDGTNWRALSGGSVTASKIVDGTIANADIATNAAIDHSKLASVTSGQILVGNGSNVPTAVAVSGDATLSNTGALTIAGDAITTSKILNGTIANADISSSAAIDHSKLANVTSGQILVGNGSNVPTAVAVSGDATLANTGALTIANDAITTDKILNGTIDTVDIASGAVTSAKILNGTIDNTDISSSAAIGHSKLASITSGQILVGNSSNVPTAVAVSGDATLANTGALTIANNAVTTAKIADSNVTGAKLSADARHTRTIDATAKTSAYTISASDGTVLVDTSSSGSFTVTLPTASGIAGRAYTVKLVNGTDMILDGNGSETIDGSTTKILSTTYGANTVEVISDGSNWRSIAQVGMDSGSITNSHISSSAAIAHSKLASLTSGYVLVGTSGNVAAARTISGDATLSNTGVLTITTDAVGAAEIAADAVGASEIATSAVTTAEILDATVSPIDLKGLTGDGTSGQLLTSSGASGFTWASPSGFSYGSNLISGGGSTDDFVFGSSTLAGTANRFWFDNSKYAFRAGRVTGTEWDDANVGTSSFAGGYNTKASGIAAVAFGSITTASGDYSFTAGGSTAASGNYSFAAGGGTTASGLNSFAVGSGTTASGSYSFAAGGGTTAAAGFASLAIGYNTTASTNYAYAIGYNATASALYSFATGKDTTASGSWSAAFNYNTTTTGQFSTAMGTSTTAQAYASLTIGKFNTLTGSTTTWVSTDPIFVIGNGSSASPGSDAFVINKNGSGTMAGALTQNSDIRLKHKIEPLGSVIEKIKNLRGVRYEFKDTETHPAGTQIGVIAQEVEKEFPELVTTGSNGYLNVAYSHLAPILLEATKEQQTMIESQQETLTQQQNENKAQQQEIASLKEQLAQQKTELEQIKSLLMASGLLPGSQQMEGLASK
ncbi:tail fiber domain-containing protein, partial [Deltaproteobacteria bacterium TL4]